MNGNKKRNRDSDELVGGVYTSVVVVVSILCRKIYEEIRVVFN